MIYLFYAEQSGINMIGAIAGDIIGSVYEFTDAKPEYDFPLFSEGSRFTDDTVLTVALADSILNKVDYKIKVKEYVKLYPNCSYGGSFIRWANSHNDKPYNSWGNGSAMRVSPVGWAYNDPETVLQKAKERAEITHNHPEGIKGAQATALAILLSRQNVTKSEIKKEIEVRFGYNLDLDLEDLRENYRFNESCQETVPQAIYTFLESSSFEDSIRKAIYVGGDSDTVACINGSIAEAFYKGVPKEIKKRVKEKLDTRLIKVVEEFERYFNIRS
jgi:ADP-ribosylglycohydrolase